MGTAPSFPEYFEIFNDSNNVKTLPSSGFLNWDKNVGMKVVIEVMNGFTRLLTSEVSDTTPDNPPTQIISSVGAGPYLLEKGKNYTIRFYIPVSEKFHGNNQILISAWEIYPSVPKGLSLPTGLSFSYLGVATTSTSPRSADYEGRITGTISATATNFFEN